MHICKHWQVNKIKERKSEENFANTTHESSITSTPNRHPSEDVPKVISKKNSYVGVEEKRGVVLPKVSPMASPLLGNEENEEKRDSQYWRSKGRRKLSRVLKAILFETSLVSLCSLQSLFCWVFLVSFLVLVSFHMFFFLFKPYFLLLQPYYVFSSEMLLRISPYSSHQLCTVIVNYFSMIPLWYQ